MKKEDLLEFYRELPKGEIWINEALFGYQHVKSYLDSLSSGDRILEIGCGSGILLSLIKDDYPNLLIEGLEPLGLGFAQLEIYHERLRQRQIVVENVGYEGVMYQGKYDLIFLVNVFEHLANWVDFLSFVKKHLKSDGLCVILCPNYGFPYESHFRIPIIVNKKITQFVFQKKIQKHELEHNCQGLWQSLNFVKLRQVRKVSQEIGLDLNFDANIVASIIDRLDEDREFAKRQRIVSSAAKLVKRLGLLTLLNLPMVQNFTPYMKLEIRMQEI